MTTLELTLNLPGEIGGKAQAAGLLNPAAIERLLRELTFGTMHFVYSRPTSCELRVLVACTPARMAALR